MGGLTTYARSALANHTFNNTSYTPAATLYLALCTADPTDAATGASMNEVSNTASYARAAIAFNAASSRRVTQNGLLQFIQLTGTLGTASHWVIVTSATYGAGNALAFGAFAVAKSLVSGNRPYINDGEVYVEITNEISTYLAGKLLDRMFRNQAYSCPATYVGMAGTNLTAATTGSDVDQVSDSRVVVNPNGGASPAWSTVSNGALSNGADVEIDLTADTVTSVFIADASTAGNILVWDNAMGDQVAGADDTALFEAGDLAIQFT